MSDGERGLGGDGGADLGIALFALNGQTVSIACAFLERDAELSYRARKSRRQY
jgi:hypothetical protein